MPTKTQKKYVPGSLGKYFAMFVAPALIVYLVFSMRSSSMLLSPTILTTLPTKQPRFCAKQPASGRM